ncbi:MAG: preprotein translocase subunit YajC [Planctomycetota bacterium]|jgi:preprotein translocase subunit YajC
MSHSLPNGLRWRAEFRAAAPQGGGGHAEKAEPQTIKRGPGSGNSEGTPGTPGEGQQRNVPQGEQPNCMGQMWMLIPMFLILWFLLIRPQQKQEKAHKALVAALKKGDRVVTNSGMHGTVVRIADDTDTVVLKLDQEGKLKATFDRKAVGRVVSDGQGQANR